MTNPFLLSCPRILSGHLSMHHYRRLRIVEPICIFSSKMIDPSNDIFKPHATAGAPMADDRREFFTTLPGGAIVVEGMEDFERGEETIPSLLVQIGAPQLRWLGLNVPPREPMPEHRLYDLLSQYDPDSAHSRYNSLIRLLVSFERAASCANE
jgi:hypothetical protein